LLETFVFEWSEPFIFVRIRSLDLDPAWHARTREIACVRACAPACINAAISGPWEWASSASERSAGTSGSPRREGVRRGGGRYAAPFTPRRIVKADDYRPYLLMREEVLADSARHVFFFPRFEKCQSRK